MKFTVLPAVEIHCWGGLGSQLYAWALHQRVSLNFTRRRICLVFHTGGVTERLEELGAFFPDAQIVKDFSRKLEGGNTSSGSSAQWTRKLGKFLALKLGLISSCNNEAEFKKLKPWVLQIRGHYSDCVVPEEVLIWIIRETKKLGIDKEDFLKSDFLGIHLRLGDLLTLSEKSPTNPESVRVVLQELADKYNYLKLVAFSDSPDLIRKMLHGPHLESITVLDLGAWETLLILSDAKILIGTSSKISIWAVLLGLTRGTLSTAALPQNLQAKVSRNLGTRNYDSLKFY